MTRSLPSEILNDVYEKYALHLSPSPSYVCKTWYKTKQQRLENVIRIQRAYRKWRVFYDKTLEETHGDYDTFHLPRNVVIRMYMLFYPIHFLRGWPDLALKKCPNMTDEQRALCTNLPSRPNRTRRDVRNVMLAMDVHQIMYVGW
jgi:hypothetical protein